ncbi:MAG: hypothetical protein NXI04_12715 [Planctomycetaceae bacterium]|nr:hypothetical protein [Planctomycetaceae bacterium]
MTDCWPGIPVDEIENSMPSGPPASVVRNMYSVVLTLVATEMTAPATTTAELIHQYCFTEDATDFVGSSNATLHGGASIVGGQLVLDGVDDYASLPIGATIAAANSVTIEGWATVTENRTWSRLFDFGSAVRPISEVSLGGTSSLNQKIHDPIGFSLVAAIS